MVYRRERPKVRRLLEGLMADYGWSAWELSEFTHCDPTCPDDVVPFSLWPTWRVQLRKMIEEEEKDQAENNTVGNIAFGINSTSPTTRKRIGGSPKHTVLISHSFRISLLFSKRRCTETSTLNHSCIL